MRLRLDGLQGYATSFLQKAKKIAEAFRAC